MPSSTSQLITDSYRLYS